MEKLQHKLEQGIAFPATQFVTSAVTGALIKVHMAPFLSAGGRVAGMILTVQDVTEMMERDARRRLLLRNFALGVRAPVANLSAAAERLASARPCRRSRSARSSPGSWPRKRATCRR